MRAAKGARIQSADASEEGDLMPTQPQLGYGKQSEVSINAVNQWMRSQPWWQQIKGNSQDISDQQKQQILAAARAQGVVVDSSNMEVDKAGNFNPIGHKLRNTLIVAGIAGAAIAAPYIIPHLAGTAASAAPAAGTLAGVEGGAYGLSAEALAALGGGAMSAVPVAATVGGATLGAAETAGAWDAAGNFIGPSTYGSSAGGGGGILSQAGNILSNGQGIRGYLDTAGQIGDALGGLSRGRQQGRIDETNATQGQDRNALYRYNAQLGQADMDLKRKNYTLDAPGKRASNSVRGDILANAQDVSIGLPSTIPQTTISGGLRPSMFSANTRALGGEMSSQALASQQAGDTFSDLPAPPELTPLPQAGKTDSILNSAAGIASLLSSLSYRRRTANG